MQFLIVPLCDCVAAGCCWYTIFRCCGCIDDGTGHVEIEKQVIPTNSNPFVLPAPPPPVVYKPAPNPFTKS